MIRNIYSDHEKYHLFSAFLKKKSILVIIYQVN